MPYAFQFQRGRILKFAFFPMFHLVTPPRGGADFDPMGIMNKLGRDYLGDAIYQISKLYAFQF